MYVPAEALVILKSDIWGWVLVFSTPSLGAQLISTLRASIYITRNGLLGLNLPRCDSNSAAGEAAVSVSWADEAFSGEGGEGGGERQFISALRPKSLLFEADANVALWKPQEHRRPWVMISSSCSPFHLHRDTLG